MVRGQWLGVSLGVLNFAAKVLHIFAVCWASTPNNYGEGVFLQAGTPASPPLSPLKVIKSSVFNGFFIRSLTENINMRRCATRGRR